MVRYGVILVAGAACKSVQRAKIPIALSFAKVTDMGTAQRDFQETRSNQLCAIENRTRFAR